MANGHQAGQAALILIAALLLLAALSMAGAVAGPVVFALFITALLYPLQRNLQVVTPRYVALAISFAAVVLVLLAFGWLVAWAFGQVGRRLIADAARLQQFYEQMRVWLEGHGVVVASLWADNFGVGWILRTVQTISGRLNSTFSFWLVTLVYVLLILMEVEDFGRRAKALRNKMAVSVLLEGSRQTAIKIRRYMLIRTAMSVATGLLVWIFARALGLPLSEEWGFIAFTLNYIPFIGSFIATLLPTLFAMMQFETWYGVLVIFIGLNLIQTIGGSYIEPRLSGSALSMSPTLVLFSIFLWGYLWGIFGAFIGVPISIAVLTYCAQHPATAWIARLLGGSAAEAPHA